MSVQAAINSAIGAVGNTAATMKFINNSDPGVQKQRAIDEAKSESKRLDATFTEQLKDKTKSIDHFNATTDLNDIDTFGPDGYKNLFKARDTLRDATAEDEEIAKVTNDRKQIAKQIYALTGDDSYLKKYENLNKEAFRRDLIAKEAYREYRDASETIKASQKAYDRLIESYMDHHNIADATEARQRWLEDRDKDPSFNEYVKGQWQETRNSYLKGGNK